MYHGTIRKRKSDESGMELCQRNSGKTDENNNTIKKQIHGRAYYYSKRNLP